MNDYSGIFIVYLIAVWLVLTFIVGVVAVERGRDSLLFFLYALIASPIIALLVLIALPVKSKEDLNKTRCPHCHGQVDRGVPCCMHCGRNIYWHPGNEHILLAHTEPIVIPDPVPEEAPPVVTPPPPVKPIEMLDVECPDCSKRFPVQSNAGTIETICPHCQSILKLETALA